MHSALVLCLVAIKKVQHFESYHKQFLNLKNHLLLIICLFIRDVVFYYCMHTRFLAFVQIFTRISSPEMSKHQLLSSSFFLYKIISSGLVSDQIPIFDIKSCFTVSASAY